MIFVNFKTYQESSGERAIALGKIIEEVASLTQIKIIPVVQATDLKELSQSLKIEVWVQSIDPENFGAHTGAILPEAVLENGAGGTFLNHSENKFADFSQLASSVERARQVNLKSLVFASNLEELGKIGNLKPDFLAYEPPEFIGSTTTSVAQAQPEIILKAVEIAKSFGLPLVVGAGIHSARDVQKSLQMGAVGVAVSSYIVKALDPKKELLDLVEGFK